jgi:hypothetical protein
MGAECCGKGGSDAKKVEGEEPAQKTLPSGNSSSSSLDSSSPTGSQAEGLGLGRAGAGGQGGGGPLLGAGEELAAALTTANVMEQLNAYTSWAH